MPYKQHFDYLRSLTPTNRELIENKKVRISLGKHKLNAYPLEGDDWEDSLAKELVLDKDVKASHAEIAACCLWHTSFWSYLPYQREETLKKSSQMIRDQYARQNSIRTSFLRLSPQNGK